MQYNICDYGATSDGKLCTKEIQAAIDACFLSGGGEVVIPRGTFVTGGLRIRSNVTLHLMGNAVLQGSIDPEDYTSYINDEIEPIPMAERDTPVNTVKQGAQIGASAFPYSRWNNALIRAIKAKNIAIIGEKGSFIDGQNCFDEQGEEDYRGPHAINMWFCENVTLGGYTIRDSANWAHAIQNSKNITVNGITVLGGHDGFDVRTCDHILVENSRFLTGDDCIAGFDNIDVTVRNCHFESVCRWIRFGGTNVLVENCRGVYPSTYGFRGRLSAEEKRNRMPTTPACIHECREIFQYYCDNRAAVRETPGNILFRNCEFTSAKRIMGIPFGTMWCCNRSLHDITFENCNISGIINPALLDCPKEEPLALLKLKNCTVSTREDAEQIPFAEGKNVQKIVLENVAFSSFSDPLFAITPAPEAVII